MATQRHELVFSMSDTSHSRLQALLERCGHSNLNLLLARGLALVEYVLDQTDAGRSVGSVGADGDEFLPLNEREELVNPPKGSRTTTSTAGAGSEGLPARAQVTSINPKLMPRPRVPVAAAAPVESEPRARRLFKHPAFAVNDAAGPVRSLAFHKERCDALGFKQPIEFNGHALPGELCLSHLDELQVVMDTESMATHFQLCQATDVLSFYGYFPNSGWHRMSAETREWLPDAPVSAGEVSLFAMDMAAFYLRRQRDRAEQHLLQA